VEISIALCTGELIRYDENDIAAYRMAASRGKKIRNSGLLVPKQIVRTAANGDIGTYQVASISSSLGSGG
jgi:hypothetical protein